MLTRERQHLLVPNKPFVFVADIDNAGIIVSAVVLVFVVMIHFSVTAVTTLSVAITDRYQGVVLRRKVILIIIIRTLI